MKLSRVFLPILFSAVALPASREIVELQRDVASLQEQVRSMQRTLDEKMASLITLVQQGLDTSSKSNTSIAVLESGLRDRISEQQKTLTAPVAAMTAKLDQMSTDVQSVRESVADLTERMNKLQTQITDLSNTVKVLNQPPAAPPPSGTTGAALTPPAGMSAKQLYDTAVRDRSAGNLELSLQGFQEFLKYYGTTELGANAQFYVGQIYYDKNDYANALQAFDLVLERFPENPKTPDALYMKGMTLLKSGQRNEAGKEFLNLIQQYPNAEVTAKARAQRRALGLSVPPSSTASRKR